MVQRKLPRKLGIQADYVKNEKRLPNIKPSSQHQDGKDRGDDLKKKMKRSKSLKHSDIERIGSLRRLPSRDVPAIAPTLQRQPTGKTTDGSPNYMKSTSSSDARKESLPVSTRTKTNSSSSKVRFASANKPTKTLTRTSSLKPVKTLTKTASFKSARASLKCSEVAHCADINVQRDTCSSIQKDSKFPLYLTLHPGGTESEGTTVEKVCHFTYCSLNGHHRDPLPSLKCFLRANRSSLKTQKSMKQEAINTNKANPDGRNQIAIEDVLFGDKPKFKEVDPGMEIFLEIYGDNKADKATRRGTEQDNEFEGREESDYGRQVTESMSDMSPLSKLDGGYNFVEYSDLASEINITGKYPEENEDPSIFEEENATPGSLCTGSYFEGVCHELTEDDTVSETTDMEWDEENFPSIGFDIEEHYSLEDEYHNIECFSKSMNSDLQDGPLPIPEDIISSGYQDILADEILQEGFEEERGLPESQSNYGRDSDPVSYHDLETNNQLSRIEDASDYSPTMVQKGGKDETKLINFVLINLASVKELSPVPIEATEEAREYSIDQDASNEVIDISLEPNCMTKSNSDHQEDNSPVCVDYQDSAEISQVETTEQQNRSQKFEDPETEQTVSTISCNLVQDIEEQDCQLSEVQLLDETQFSHDFSETDQVIVKIDDTEILIPLDPCQLNHSAEDSDLSEEPTYEGRSLETEDNMCGGECNSADVDNENFMRKGQGEPDTSCSTDSDQSDSRIKISSLGKNCIREVENLEMEDKGDSEAADALEITIDMIKEELEPTFLNCRENLNHIPPETCNNRKWTIGSRNLIDECDEQIEFNPREPNYLPVIPDPDAEKVDLRHQMIDDRKNAEEWMLDFALQQTVTKLAPARKKKVALLVEAFETVSPILKYEPRQRHTPVAFVPTRHIQACS